MRFVLAFVVALVAISGCKGANTPTSPSTVEGTNPQNQLQSGMVAVMGPDGQPLPEGTSAQPGGMVSVTMNGISCENSSFKYGHRYIREDGEILGPRSGFPCSVPGPATISNVAVNNLLPWGRGHTVTVEFIIMSSFPDPIVYNRVIGQFVIAD